MTLRDADGGTRVYDVPAGFTEDLLTHGGPAWRKLDLTRLDPQPGYVASATASESAGVAEHRVVSLEVWLGSSGAIDDVCFDPHPQGDTSLRSVAR